MQFKYDLNDVVIIPAEQSDINSRSECYVFTKNNTLPLFAAPMDTVVDNKNIETFIDNGIIPCIPRNNHDFPNIYNSYFFKSFSLSEIEEQLDFYDHIITAEEVKCKVCFYHYNNVLIDIANGHMSKLTKVIKRLKQEFPDIKLMVGNIANPQTYKILAEAGADYIRCSIGSGAGCFIENTKIITKTGKKNIKDINIGDMVLTHKGNYKEVINKISYTEEDDLIKINDTTSTIEHKYYVLNKKYKNIVNDDNLDEYAEWIESNKLTNDFFLIELNT